MKPDEELLRERPHRRVARALRQATASRRSRPSYLIVGTQKGGTTSLFDHLATHPGVRAPRYKEVHYFDWFADRPFSYYLSSFPLGNWSTGEASPYYLFHPYVPERVARVLPEIKLIALLRNPADRALSHHNHNVALGLEELDFEEALDAEEARLAGEAESLAEPGTLSMPHRHFSYLARGRYAEQLERWLEHFPREQLLVLSSEEFFADPQQGYSETLRFLGLPEHALENVTARNARAYDAMPAATRARLDDHFAPDNARLAELVGRDFGW